ncbi:hypothetical protein KQI52_11430 [bacterium]|nr:hypothetical protein [bacterium]
MIRTWTRRRLDGPALRFVASLLLLAGFAACSGEDGPAGLDGTSPDTYPPAVALLSPSAGDTLGDTMRVIVSAVDNVAIDRVVFYVDGSDQVDDTSYAEVAGADAVDNQFVWTFNLVQMGVSNGPHTVMARAFDVDRNYADTPPVIVFTEYQTPPGEAVLRVWEPDSTGFYQFPNRNANDPSIVLDSLHNVRFRAERDGQIDQVRLYLSVDAFASLAFDTTLHVAVHESDGVYPLAAELSSQDLTTAAFDSTRWYSVIFPDNVTFEADEIFHISLSVPEKTDTTAFAIGTSIIPKYDYPTQSHSSRWRIEPDAAYWQPLQTQYALEERTREFMIEVWVTYE